MIKLGRPHDGQPIDQEHAQADPGALSGELASVEHDAQCDCWPPGARNKLPV